MLRYQLINLFIHWLHSIDIQFYNINIFKETTRHILYPIGQDAQYIGYFQFGLAIPLVIFDQKPYAGIPWLQTNNLV